AVAQADACSRAPMISLSRTRLVSRGGKLREQEETCARRRCLICFRGSFCLETLEFCAVAALYERRFFLESTKYRRSQDRRYSQDRRIEGVSRQKLASCRRQSCRSSRMSRW